MHLRSVQRVVVAAVAASDMDRVFSETVAVAAVVTFCSAGKFVVLVVDMIREVV